MRTRPREKTTRLARNPDFRRIIAHHVQKHIASRVLKHNKESIAKIFLRCDPMNLGAIICKILYVTQERIREFQRIRYNPRALTVTSFEFKRSAVIRCATGNPIFDSRKNRFFIPWQGKHIYKLMEPPVRIGGNNQRKN